MIRNCTLLVLLPLVCVTFLGCEVVEGESLPHAESSEEGAHDEHAEASHKIVVTSPAIQDVISTQQYVCQIHSRRHIEVRALEEGYLLEIHVQEGQTVKQDDLMFKIQPVLYKARLDSELAEAELAQLKVNNTKRLVERKVVSEQELALAQAEFSKVQAKAELARAELNFTDVKAPFDGIVDRQLCQQGSLIEEGDILTTLSDNSVMWVYFNVPEAAYLQYKTELDEARKQGHEATDLKIDLKLANGQIFAQPGKIGAIEADFNNTTGNIAFRADFSNPDSLLRNGQTGTILIHRTLHDVTVIPQRATFEILDRRYVYVVGEDGVVHQRDISLNAVLDDVFVIKEGLAASDKLILEGIRQVRDGDKVEYEFQSPEEVLAHLKHHAE
ncbi:MAG: efflux RND transporter periplasmic adaptor subunit [Planctomycetaceae bacterium]